MEEQSDKINYDDANFGKLMSELKTLSTFAAIASWDNQAQTEIERITSVIQQLASKISSLTQALDSLRKSKSEKSIMARLFSGNKEEKDAMQLLEKLDGYKVTLGNMAMQLQESIDFTPNSPEEQKVLMKELRQRKKELQVEKREVAAAMKAVRTGARQQSVNAGLLFGVIYDSKTAAYQRRSIRYEKEAALRPHEDAKAAIERQLVQTDRDILWAERFKQ